MRRSRKALAVLFNKTLPCPPVASHKLTLIVPGESQPGAFSHDLPQEIRTTENVTDCLFGTAWRAHEEESIQ